MRGMRILMSAACLPLVLAAGCGGSNTYNPALVSGPTPDFSITAYKGDANAVGDGTGLTPNSVNNRAGLDLGGSVPITFVLKAINGFSGTITVSAGSPSGPFTVSTPTPASVSLSGSGSADSTVTIAPSQSAVAGNVGAVTISATSGNVTHTATAYFKVNTPAGDFTVTLYAGDANTVGDGTGLTPISANNRAVVLGQARPITVVVKSTNGFSGSVTVSVGLTNGPFSITQPVPATITVPVGSFKNTSFTFNSGEGAQTGSTGDAPVTVTSGNLTHGATAYFVFNPD